MEKDQLYSMTKLRTNSPPSFSVILSLFFLKTALKVYSFIYGGKLLRMRIFPAKPHFRNEQYISFFRYSRDIAKGCHLTLTFTVNGQSRLLAFLVPMYWPFLVQVTKIIQRLFLPYIWQSDIIHLFKSFTVNVFFLPYSIFSQAHSRVEMASRGTATNLDSGQVPQYLEVGQHGSEGRRQVNSKQLSSSFPDGNSSIRYRST